MKHLSDLFVFAVVCVLLLTACPGKCADANSYITSYDTNSVPDVNNHAKDSNGPTVILDYTGDGIKTNPVSSFMYFVPLLAPTRVERQTSPNDELQISVISYNKKIGSKYFSVSCEFKMIGKGFHKVIFDPVGMIAQEIRDTKEDEPLTNLLDYIEFHGEGIGRVDVKGTMAGSVPTVTEVAMHFNARGQKSPVVFGLYSVKPVDGQYKYENRYDELIARLNTLTFKKTGLNPKMGLKIASVTRQQKSDGFWGHVEAAIANFFMPPAEVTKIGNDTMLNFGHALLVEKPAFTFPKAKNIKESKVVKIADKGK